MHFEIHDNFQARNVGLPYPKPSTWLHMLTEEEEEEVLQPGLEKSLRCSFPSLRTDVRAAIDNIPSSKKAILSMELLSLRTDVRAAEDWREPGQSWETADLC